MSVSEKVLYIEASGKTDGQEWSQGGTGILLRCRPNDIIVTCLHVLQKGQELARKVEIWPQGVAKTSNQAYSAQINPTKLQRVPPDARDLAILELDSQELGFEGVTIRSEATKGSEVVIHGYPLGNKRIAHWENEVVRPCNFWGEIGTKRPNAIYAFRGDNTACGVSGGPAIAGEALIGILRGRWNPQGNYHENVLIGCHWIKRLCEQANYELLDDFNQEILQEGRFIDTNWRKKLDLRQARWVALKVREMLFNEDGERRASAFIWYGAPQTGLKNLSERIKIELSENQIKFWPCSFSNQIPSEFFLDSLPEQYWKTMLNVAEYPADSAHFGEKFATRLNQEAPAMLNGKKVVFVQHDPFVTKHSFWRKLFNIKDDAGIILGASDLQQYFDWLNNHFLGRSFNLPKDIYFVFGLPFVSNNYNSFRKNYMQIIRKQKRYPGNFFCIEMLDPLKKVSIDDVIEFLIHARGFKQISDDKEKLIHKILHKTGGHYEKTRQDILNIL